MKIRAHESFYFRKGWLHKGIKHLLENDRLFIGETNPCDILGIGANMVKSIRYWLQATQLMEEKNENGRRIQCVTPIGQVINKYDKYFEEQGTNYILQYLLASNIDQATAWYWFFNVFKGSVIDKNFFVTELAEYLKINFDYITTNKVLEDEFNCLIRTYSNKEEREEDPEETKLCPLSELNLLQLIDKKNKEYKKISPLTDDIHPIIIYAIICDNIHENQLEILINDICQKERNVGKIFNLDRIGIIKSLENLTKLGYVSMSRTAGLDVVRVIKKKTIIECLELYYKMLDGEINNEPS